MRIYLEPTFDKPDAGDGGIRRVVDAQRKYLPEFGIEIVKNKAKADLTVGHGAIINLKPDAPFVSHSHGLHWSDYVWDGDWVAQTNRRVIDALLCADAITVPSQWVKRAFGRGMMRDFRVIYHGIDADEWEHTERQKGYALWNKPRQDAVSDAGDVMKLAARMSDVKFVSTIGKATDNLKIIGVQPYAEHKKYIQQAGVYLATARETFGIGTLEALASGVPVAGWRHGGQAEIILEGETGYLAEPGDYEELAECVRKCFMQRRRLSRQAREDTRARWGWLDKIEQYAALYKCTLANYHSEPKVSVIVTCHNLAKYLLDALRSVKEQSFKDFECIIVDDASTDDTERIARESGFIYIKTPENLGLSRARNFGLAKAKGKYILNLDADDILAPSALTVLSSALDKNPALHVTYGGLDTMNENGSDRKANSFPGKFNWLGQMAHLNQLHYAAMMRKSVLVDSGGYRERQWRAEDAEMWCRVSSYGFRIEKVTDEPTLIWRGRPDSKSQQERKKYTDIDGDWCAGFPWRIASSGQEGSSKIRQQGLRIPNAHLIPFGAPVLSGEAWKIPHGETPAVSVIIPLGLGHERYVIDSLDSLVAQTIGDWEAIVVNDTGKPIESIPGAPYARIVSTEDKRGAGAARNVGIQNARAPLVLFLDADDTLRPDALMKMLEAYAKGNAGYVYTDWEIAKADHTSKPGRAADSQPKDWLYKGQHAITVLMATEDARKIPFDENMPGWEDWDFFIQAGIHGICGVHITEPLLVYREYTGTRRGKAFEQRTELLDLLKTRYREYIEGSKTFMGCGGGCGGAAKRARAAISVRSVNTPVRSSEPKSPDERVRMEFTGRQLGPVTYHVNNHDYAGAATAENKYIDALPQDVSRLEALGLWKRVEKVAA